MKEALEQSGNELFVTGCRTAVAAGENGWQAAVGAPAGAASLPGRGLPAGLYAGEGPQAIGIALIHTDRIECPAGRLHLICSSIWEVDRKAVGVRHVGGSPVIDDCAAKGIAEGGSFICTEKLRKMNQVNLIHRRAAREFSGAVSGAGNAAIAVVLQAVGQRKGKTVES